MVRTSFALALAILCLLPAEARSQTSNRLPRVYGPTGQPYGPTQAHYQYMRQYGRSWDGTTPQQAMSLANGSPQYAFGTGVRRYRPFIGGHVLGHYDYPPYAYGPYSYGPFGYSFGLNYSLNVPQPVWGLYSPAPFVGPDPQQWAAQNLVHNPALVDALRENELRWGQPLEVKPVVPKMAKPSTPEAKLRSIRHQAQGDVWFRQQNYSEAYDRYNKAVSEAGDQAEARFRLGFVLTAVGRYERAVREFKLGLQIDPGWPQTGEGLGHLLGPENELARGSIVHKVAAWVREDVRDPDRLFLMGLLLHFDDTPDRSVPFFEAALRMTGGGDHLHAFLQPGDEAAAQNQADPEWIPPAPMRDDPVPPEAVDPAAAPGDPAPPAIDLPEPEAAEEPHGPLFPGLEDAD